MSFTDVPPSCTHSSRAVHPVLSSPPPPELTQLTARTQTPPQIHPPTVAAAAVNVAHSHSFLSFFLSCLTREAISILACGDDWNDN